MHDAPPRQADPIGQAVAHWTAHGWHDEANAMAVVTSIMRVHQLLLARVEQVLRPHGLTFARFEVLRLLAFSRTGTLPIGKIGERLQVHAASATSAVQRLDRDGHVQRLPNPRDGRGVLVELTEAGRTLVESCTATLNAQVFGPLPLSPASQVELFESLRAIRVGFGDACD